MVQTVFHIKKCQYNNFGYNKIILTLDNYIGSRDTKNDCFSHYGFYISAENQFLSLYLIPGQ